MPATVEEQLGKMTTVLGSIQERLDKNDKVFEALQKDIGGKKVLEQEELIKNKIQEQLKTLKGGEKDEPNIEPKTKTKEEEIVSKVEQPIEPDNKDKKEESPEAIALKNLSTKFSVVEETLKKNQELLNHYQNRDLMEARQKEIASALDKNKLVLEADERIKGIFSSEFEKSLGDSTDIVEVNGVKYFVNKEKTDVTPIPVDEAVQTFFKDEANKNLFLQKETKPDVDSNTPFNFNKIPVSSTETDKDGNFPSLHYKEVEGHKVMDTQTYYKQSGEYIDRAGLTDLYDIGNAQEQFNKKLEQEGIMVVDMPAEQKLNNEKEIFRI